MEHSRLLKFLNVKRFRKMATPTYKIELDFDNSNVQSEVPETQPIRTPQDTIDNETGYEITDLSPPILTVTKKETTLTKGDLKFQKVTVTDDVSTNDNISHHEDMETSNDEITTPRNSRASISNDSENDSGKSDREGKLERKSKIPMLRLRQAIQKVQEEQKEMKNDRLKNHPRRSSIPRLNIKSPKIEVTSLKTEEEFEKLYNDTIENTGNNETSAKIDDPDKIESRFEEIIHAYDDAPTDRSVIKEVTRLSRIPALRRKDDEKTKLGGLTERAKAKTADTDLKDGGFRVTDSKIKIKRFSRGNSRDLGADIAVETQKPDVINTEVQDPSKVIPSKPKRSKINIKNSSNDGKLDITEKYEEINDGNTKLSKKTIITEEVRQMPIRKLVRSTTDMGPDGAVEIVEKIETIPPRVITNETLIAENGVPTKKERIVLDVSGEKQTIEIIKKSDDDIATSNSVVTENIALENITLKPVIISENTTNEFDTNEKENLTSNVEENDVKFRPKIVKPVTPKSNKNNIIGSVKSIEIAKTFERKQGPNIKSTTYSRSYSENPKSFTNFDKIDSKFEEIEPNKHKVDNTDDFDSKTREHYTPKRPILNKSYSVGIPKGPITHLDKEITSKLSLDIIEKDEIQNKQTLIDITPPNEDTQSPKKDVEKQDEEIRTIDRFKEVESLPKKQSVLSKIAIFEGLKTPNNHKEKNLPKLKIHKNAEKKSTEKESTEFESIGFINHDDSTYDTVYNDQINYTPHNTPIIVKEIWKTGENPSAINPVIIEKHLDSKILGNNKVNVIENIDNNINIKYNDEKPEKIEIKRDPEVKYRKTSIGKKVSHPDRYSIEMPTIIPPKIDALDELRALSPQPMPIRIEKDNPMFQSNVTGFDNEEVFEPQSEASNSTPSEALTITKVTEDKIEIKRKNPSKFDFSGWQKKVLANKSKIEHLDEHNNKSKLLDLNVDTRNEKISKNIDELVNVVDETKIEDKYNTESYVGKHKDVYQRHHSFDTDNNNDFVTEETVDNGQKYNKDISLIEAINFVPQTIEYEVKHIDSDTVPLKTQRQPENISELQQKRPGKIDFSAWQHKVESNKPKIKKTEFKIEKPKKPIKFEPKLNTDERIHSQDFKRDINPIDINKSNVNKNYDHHVESINNNNRNLRTDPSYKDDASNISCNSTENLNYINKNHETNDKLGDNTDFEQSDTNLPEMTYDEAINSHFSDLDKYITPNDEIEDENDVTAGNSLQSESYYDETKDHINNDLSNEFGAKPNIDENDTYSNDIKKRNYLNQNYDTFTKESKENELNANSHKVENSIESDVFDMRRAQSLAELGGNAVKGNVQRILGRIKSVDLENKMDKAGNRRISVKEMPKKMTVLERIALFEGRTTSQNETTTPKPEPSKPAPEIPEEVYLQKIEELTTGKMRLGQFEDMLYWKMANQQEIPVLALGTALMDKRLIPYIIGAAIDMGYRAFDCAYIYGNEKEVGKAINDKIKDGTVQREDLFIISKLWSTFHNPALVETACRRSLDNMGLEYFDLYLIHNPMSFKEGPDPIPKISGVLQYSEFSYIDAWYGMEPLIQHGLVKSIGVSNFNAEQIRKILAKGRIRPVVNQVECHPYLAQQRLNAFCNEQNITLSCFATLGSKGTPAEYKSGVSPVIDDPLVKTMALGLGVTPAQLLIRYQIENGRNVVVKSSSAAHLWDNLQALSFTLEPAQVDALTALNRNKRIFTFNGMGDTHKNYPFKAPF